jgi:hypothetical protein
MKILKLSKQLSLEKFLAMPQMFIAVHVLRFTVCVDGSLVNAKFAVHCVTVPVSSSIFVSCLFKTDRHLFKKSSGNLFAPEPLSLQNTLIKNCIFFGKRNVSCLYTPKQMT